MTEKIDLILVGLLFLNALINVYLLIKDYLKTKERMGSDPGDIRFFRLYILVVPFFLTRSILNEIEMKRNKTKKFKL